MLAVARAHIERGTPDHAVGELSAAFAALRRCPTARLCAVVEGRVEPRERRLAAGVLLALLGDPRIRPLDPPMVTIAGGRVMLGLDPQRVARTRGLIRSSGGDRRSWMDKEIPAYELELSPYRIGRYPVTNAEYRLFASATGHRAPAAWPGGVMPMAAANAPVASITASDADTYVGWLRRKTGRPFRLPTEAEWEHAAAGPDRTEFPWGEHFEPDRANTFEAGLGWATPVGAFPLGASSWGVLDMAGNVEEFVADTYAPYPGGVLVEDDLYQELGPYRIARGGSHSLLHDMARCRRRHGGVHPRYINPAFGFRLGEDIA